MPKSIAKGVKEFRDWRLVCLLIGGILNIEYNHWHNSYWWTLLPYDFINEMSLFQKKFVNTAESCSEMLKFRS